jgi:hypothetical protein
LLNFLQQSVSCIHTPLSLSLTSSSSLVLWPKRLGKNIFFTKKVSVLYHIKHWKCFTLLSDRYKGQFLLYGYFLSCSIFLRAISPPLALMTTQEATLSGNFRAAHQRLVWRLFQRIFNCTHSYYLPCLPLMIIRKQFRGSSIRKVEVMYCWWCLYVHKRLKENF